MKTTIHHWVFAIVAWTIFVVSFFLPALDEMPGWKAAILSATSWQQAMQGNLFAVHFMLLAVANLLMVVSPFFVFWGAQDGRFVKWFRGLSIAAAVLVWSFPGWLLFGHHMADLKIGYYLWAASFVVLCVASLMQPATVKGKAAETA